MAEQPSQKKVMTDEERQKLAKSLDDELDQFIEGLQKSKYKDGWNQDTWEKVRVILCTVMPPLLFVVVECTMNPVL